MKVFAAFVTAALVALGVLQALTWARLRKPEPAFTPRERAAIHLMLGTAAGGRGDLPAAEREYREAIRTDPGLVYAYHALASTLQTDGRHDDARAACEACLKANPGDVDAQVLLGNFAMHEGKVEEAERFYKAVLEARPDSIGVRSNLGRLYSEAGRLDDAEAQYLKIIETNADYPPTLNDLGVVCWKRGDLAKAETYFRRAVAGDPGNLLARSNLEKLREASASPPPGNP